MLKKFVIEIYHIWIIERPSQLAAALAYYGMFSFAPLIFIAFSVAGIFVDEVAATGQFYQRLESILGEDVAILVQDSINALSTPSSTESTLISIISLMALLYAASGVFFQLQYVLNSIWHVPLPEKGKTFSFIRKRLFSFLMVIGIGLLGIFAVFTNLLLASFSTVLESLLGINASMTVATGVAALLLVIFSFALFYKVLPETKIAWKDVWLGASIAALLTMAAVFLAGLFFQYSSFSSALQAAGSISVLLMGFYYISQIFLLGAILCRIFANRFGSRRVTALDDQANG
jgi:membrane protein